MNDKMIEFYATAMAFITTKRDDEKGATAVEYGLLVALIAAIIVGVVYALGDTIKGAFSDVNESIKTPTTP